jgi:hypothetical protein
MAKKVSKAVAPRSGQGEHVVNGAAAALRMDGMAFAEIGATLGLSATEAKQAVSRYLASLADRMPEEDRAKMRTREDARLDKLLYAVWGKALDEENPEQLHAVKVALAIGERRAKMYGLDAPTEVINHTPTTAEIDQWAQHLTGFAASHGVTEAEVIDGELVDEEEVQDA